jgi:predicted HNH restriction endonuclease
MIGKPKKSLEKKKKLVDLMGGSCKICGYNKCLQALEFHQNDENKDHSISDLMKRSFKFSLKEITKCVLLCSNCHRELHSEMKFPIEYNGKVKSIK